MYLRLFLREHISYVVFQLVMVLFILSLYWLDGFRNIDTAVYSIVISILLIAAFLAVRFMKRVSYYKKIMSKPSTMEAVLQRDANSPEQVEVDAFLQQLYKVYQSDVHALYSSQARHLQFMNQWVHQMKTPISVVELLLQEAELDRASVQEEIDRLKRALETVLMNARLDTFEDDMQIEQVELKPLLTKVISDHKRLFITHQTFPVVDVEEGIVVASDQKWLTFLFTQLITNAIKYTFDSNKKVYVRTEIEKGKLHVSIRDEGIGIPVSDLPRVTKAFFTGENGRKTGESTGMGLYLVKEITDKLGHSFTIQSEVGKGTCVKIVFNEFFIQGKGGAIDGDTET
ncbi:sensor histidine kinase [Paenisporosarcina cavernae]|uniref:histidine kinase n=1 Tax=Paenisporosarcina cavernae TaxID=2320858 RepID=A0A385YW83_9BACL|nr:sensor histidine kinase [Paenisporosarcina cavernae]AYC30157.1 sensor histidine kinase [Paenisporosarcina cavernae]